MSRTNDVVHETAEQIACKLHVRMVPSAFDDVDVYRMFSEYGIVHDIRMPPPSSNTMHYRFAFVTFTRACMADRAKRALDGVRTIETEHCSITLDQPLRVEVYVPASQMPPRGLPLKTVNTGEPPKPLLDFKSMMSVEPPTGRQPPPPPRTIAGKKAAASASNSSSSVKGDAKVMQRVTPTNTPTPTNIELASFRSPYDLHVCVKDNSANFDSMFRQLQVTLSRAKLGEHMWKPLYLVGVLCDPRKACIDGSLWEEGDDIEDGHEQWHRAFVTSAEQKPRLSDNRYVCRLLDGGHIVRVTHEHVSQLPRQATLLPAQAIHCCVSGVAPLDNATKWSSDVCQSTREWLSSASGVKMLCHGVSLPSDGGSATLYWPTKQLVSFESSGDVFADGDNETLHGVLLDGQLAVDARFVDAPLGGDVPPAKCYSRRALTQWRVQTKTHSTELIDQFNAMALTV